MLLQISELHVSYHKKQVIFGISLTVEEGKVVALVGPNGAGKTTTLNTIIGLLHPRKGEILFKGLNITHQKASQNVRNGISLVPQGGRVFPDLSVLENLELGGYLLDPQKRKERLRYVYNLFPILEERYKQRANSLSGGERQMLAISRALMLTPDLLLLDEPSIGLAPLLVKDIMRTLTQISGEMGTSIFVVEQNVREIFQIAQKAYVLKVGKIVLENRYPLELLSDENLRKSYLS
ncbi:MAG: ABC transporter ATP-binding protein [Deltaproteobacteria bacterium]|nr:ABC transporter ATP-binding protein [Deltaproteobacteria bacterium]